MLTIMLAMRCMSTPLGKVASCQVEVCDFILVQHKDQLLPSATGLEIRAAPSLASLPGLSPRGPPAQMFSILPRDWSLWAAML